MSYLCTVEVREPPSDDSQARLLWGDKPNGAEARSSEELKFLSSQATLSYRVAVATDALIPRRRWHETKFAGRKGKATLAVSYWLLAVYY